MREVDIRLLELNLFVVGDARSVETWSGLPSGLLRGLETQGIQVNVVDLAANMRLESAYNFLRGHVLRWLHLEMEPQFLLSPLNRLRASWVIWRACRRYGRADVNLFLSFEFASRGLSRVPYAMYCDTTFWEALLKEPRRRLRRYEARRLRNEVANLRGAALVMATNQHAVTHIRERVGVDRLMAGPVYGVNLTGYQPPSADSLDEKARSLNLLFIGSHWVNRGGDILVEALRKLNQGRANPLTLHVVGFESPPPGCEDRNVVWHGRLRKDVPDDAREYWGLWAAARMLVMPLRTGPLPGVVAEAQYLGTPVVVGNCWSADQLVGNRETGILVDGSCPDDYASAIEELLSDTDLWQRLVYRGQRRADEYSWATVAEKMIRAMSALSSTSGGRRG